MMHFDIDDRRPDRFRRPDHDLRIGIERLGFADRRLRGQPRQRFAAVGSEKTMGFPDAPESNSKRCMKTSFTTRHLQNPLKGMV